MKRVLSGAVFLSVVALVAPASIANAADLPVKAYSPVPPPVTGPLWEGIYMGGNIGYAWGKASWCTEENGFSCETPPFDTTSASPGGLVGGGQFGDRWQMGNVVFGLEGLYDGLNIDTKTPNRYVAGETMTTKFTGLFSATGQLGLAVDRALFYGKGGWALTNLKLEVNNPGISTLNDSNWIDGWTVGGGIEYQIIPHLIVGVEYDYYKFSPGNLTNVTDTAGNTIACSFCNFGSSTTIQTVMARLSYQAGPPPARW